MHAERLLYLFVIIHMLNTILITLVMVSLIIQNAPTLALIAVTSLLHACTTCNSF